MDFFNARRRNLQFLTGGGNKCILIKDGTPQVPFVVKQRPYTAGGFTGTVGTCSGITDNGYYKISGTGTPFIDTYAYILLNITPYTKLVGEDITIEITSGPNRLDSNGVYVQSKELAEADLTDGDHSLWSANTAPYSYVLKEKDVSGVSGIMAVVIGFNAVRDTPGTLFGGYYKIKNLWLEK